MNAEDFKILTFRICAGFGKSYSEHELLLLFEKLQNVPYTHALQAIDLMISSGLKSPAVSEITSQVSKTDARLKELNSTPQLQKTCDSTVRKNGIENLKKIYIETRKNAEMRLLASKPKKASK